MLDIKFIVENPSEVKHNLKKRFKEGQIWMVDELIQDYTSFKLLKKEIDDLRSERNKLSKEINKLKKEKKKADKEIKEAAKIPSRVKEFEEKMDLLKSNMNEKLIQLPNMLHSTTPVGEDESKNPEIKKVGKPKKFDFKLKSHGELAESLNIADFEAGRKVAGQGFNYIIGELAQLDYALQRYGVDYLIQRGFTFVVPPMVLNKKTLSGAVNIADFKEVIYKVEGEDLYLIGTGEHPLVALFAGKVLDKKDLPTKLCTVTPCFRKEIGSRGVDTKGLFRMHQFNKVEQVMLSSKENSFDRLEEMEKITEDFFESLEIPFRVIEICSGDLGDKFAKQYDIEAWFPRQEGYKEVTSAGHCTDYQSRKLNIKYATGKEREYVHLLNNTMVATSRAMVAILENFQQKDGSVKIPKVLHEYLNFKEIKPKK